MTNSSNSTSASQWEIAGGKKTTTHNKFDVDPKKTHGMVTRKTSVPSKIPVVETLKPMKLESNYYEYFAEPDEVMEKKPKNKSPKQIQPRNVAAAPTLSPKQKKEEPINLLRTDPKNKRKSAPLSPGKKNVDELEKIISELKFENFQQKYSQLESLFPGNYGLISMHLAAFLNQSLNDIPDIEPNSNHENESNLYPSNKLDKKIEKFLNNIIGKLKRADAEYVLEYCLNEIIKNENPKVLSNHGLRIFMVLLLKQNHNLFMNNLSKTAELIHANRHRHQRVMLALCAFSQAGFLNLNNGLKLWFEVMLPLIAVKHYNIYISSLPSVLFKHHHVDMKSMTTKVKLQISLDQYLNLYELVNDKSLNTLTNKDAIHQLKSAFPLIRSAYMHSLNTAAADSELIFDMLFPNLTSETSAKQTEILEILTKCLISNQDLLLTWKESFNKNLQQTTILLDYLLAEHNKSFKSMKNMRELLVHFDKQTTPAPQNTNAQSSAKDEAKKPYYIAKKIQKSNNTALETEKFNKLIKKTLKNNFKKTSFISIMFRTFFTFALLSGLFFYWDNTQNKSQYFKACETQLEKAGLRDEALRAFEVTKKSLLDAQKLVNHHGPIYYKKASETIMPYATKARDVTMEYSELAWKNSEKLRNDAHTYYIQANEYVQENFPIVKKSGIDLAKLAYEYGLKAKASAVLYTNQATNVVGTQLLGWKKGELEAVLEDAAKASSDSIYSGVEWIKKSLRNSAQ